MLNFASSKTDLLLPALEDGIVDSDWRIRLSSVQLLGIMLLKLAGVSTRMIVVRHHNQGTRSRSCGGIFISFFFLFFFLHSDAMILSPFNRLCEQ